MENACKVIQVVRANMGDVPTCPFLNRECFSECALYAPGIQGCSFIAQTMLLEDIHKISVLAYDRYLKPTGVPPSEGEAKPPEPPAPPAGG